MSDLQRASSGASETTSVPSYGTVTADTTSLPPYSTGGIYCRISGRAVPTPFVTRDQLRAHLCFLRAIKVFRTTVEAEVDERYPEYVNSLDSSQRWIWIVGLAVERFTKWIQTVEPTDLSMWVQEQMPPLDVLMVWHTYMLNPQWYAEDCDRLKVLRKLKHLNDYLIRALTFVGDINDFEASESRKQQWQKSCGSSFDPIEAATEGTLDTHEVVCPKCATLNAVPNLLDKGTGYLQKNCSVPCTKCNYRLLKERLAVHKLLTDLMKDHTHPPDLEKYGNSVYIAGSLRTHLSAADVPAAAEIKKRIWKLEVCQAVFTQVENPELLGHDKLTAKYVETLGEKMKYSMDSVRDKITSTFHVRNSQRRAHRILSAYVDDRPFSVELVSAVLRQGSFVDKMDQFGWTAPGRFNSSKDEEVLAHALARYHAFLDLMSSAPGELFVPTLDIDLVWHTHQLTYQSYSQNCLQFVGRYIDHDDKVEESRLANSFDITCQAWQRKFGVSYTHCGCPMPIPENKLRHRLSRILSNPFSQSKSTPILNLVPPDIPDALAATHASEHNAVLSSEKPSEFASRERNARRSKVAHWVEEEKKATQKKGLPLPSRRNTDHNAAFLSAPPFWAMGANSAAVCTALPSSNDGGWSAPCTSGARCSSSTQPGCGATGGCSSSTSNCSSSTPIEVHDSHDSSSGCGNVGGSGGSSGCGSSGCGSSCGGGGGGGCGGGD